MLRAQGRLKIGPAEFNVLVHLIEHWWDASKNPHPAKELIARRMGKSPRMVQRYLTNLEKAKLIKREERFLGHKGQTANTYSLDGVVAKLRELEPAFSKEAEQKRLRQKKVESPTSGAA